jgi:hypothetical protein
MFEPATALNVQSIHAFDEFQCLGTRQLPGVKFGL